MSTHTDEVLDGFGLDPDDVPDKPPRNESEQFVCGRETKSGSPCAQAVGIPYLACSVHDPGDPILW